MLKTNVGLSDAWRWQWLSNLPYYEEIQRNNLEKFSEVDDLPTLNMLKNKDYSVYFGYQSQASFSGSWESCSITRNSFSNAPTKGSAGSL